MLITQILALKGNSNATNICYERYRAEKITFRCSNQHIPYDGEFTRSLVILDGVKAVVQADVDANGCLAEIKTMKLPDAVSDYVCRWRPSPRRHPGFVTLNNMVLASGGYTNRTDIGSDLWYRGKIPLAVQTAAAAAVY